MDDYKKSLLANDGITCDENYIWYLANEFSAVIQIERITGNATVLFVVKEYLEVFAFRSIVKYKNSLFLFPFKGSQYVEYDINAEKYSIKQIPDELWQKNWCAQYFQDNSDLFFYFQAPCIVKYDCEQDEWTIYDKWNSEIDEEIRSSDELKHWFGYGSYKYGNNYYFQLNHDNRIACLNTSFGGIRTIEMPPSYKESYLETLSGSNDGIWAMLHCGRGDSRLLFINEDLKDFKEICVLPNDGVDVAYSQIVLGRKYLWILPAAYDRGWKVLKDGSSIEELKDISIVDKSNLKPIWGRDLNYGIGRIVGDTYINMNTRAGRIVEIDIVQDKCHEYDIKPIEAYRIWKLADREVFFENPYYNLTDFLYHDCDI